MKVKYLHSYGKQDINEYDLEIKDFVLDNEIKIKPNLVGVCRSDIGAYAGWEDPMPFGRFGHEGLGTVVEIGKDITDVKIGDYVATFSDPAYADYYFAKKNEYVKVPILDPKYILQPVACGVNIIMQTRRYMELLNHNQEILLLGSGFLSTIIGLVARHCYNIDNLVVVGSANKDIWNQLGYKRYNNNQEILGVAQRRLDDGDPKFQNIIDLSSKPENFENISKYLAGEEALICYAATPTSPITTNFFANCWNCHTIICPSPRNKTFIDAMHLSKKLIEEKIINVDTLWSKGYDRKTEYKQAFEEGVHRPPNYSRGYIKW